MRERTEGSPELHHRPRMPALSAPRLLVLSFLGLVGLGTLGFAFVPGLAHEGTLSLVDALFMATSAVCVTGLTVVDVSSELTWAGQAWLLLLIQAGALGILTFAGAVAGIAGGRASLHVEEALAGPAAMIPHSDPRRLVRLTVTGTLLTEAVGAVVLWLLFRQDHGDLGAVWVAVFHAVSAFCNAGFSLFPDSLVAYRERVPLLAVFGTLIVMGGLGFPVLEELRMRLTGVRPRLCVHSRLVLGATAVLLAGGTALYLSFEGTRTLGPLGLVDKTSNALFMAVTARTAGFHTVDYDALSNASVLLTLALMWIGGAPASVAGGVKVTTVALVLLLLVSRLRGDDAVSAGGRSIPRET
ncbi:MAG: potassium transporter TrkG, partial [Myxococcota bacterium]|nr:potassium transporter TrkG [Myxococcota bacterium]